MTADQELSWFARPGPMTDLSSAPHEAFVDLPVDPVERTRIGQGLLIHEGLTALYGISLPLSQTDVEVNIRPVDRIVETALAHDPLPLVHPRPPERRVASTCRDFATLACALLRVVGVPARARVGFAAYFEPGLYEDHWVLERWDPSDRRWVRMDPQVDEIQRRLFAIDFDTEDLPDGAFLTGSEAWQSCRGGSLDAERFGVAQLRGLGEVRGNLVRDVAALNRLELLPWDNWGAIDESGPDVEQFLDRVAGLVTGNDIPSVRALFSEEPRLQPYPNVTDARFGGTYAVPTATGDPSGS